MVCFWWITIKPEAKAVWAPVVAEQDTGMIDADILTLTDIRDFRWRRDTDFKECWTTDAHLSPRQGEDRLPVHIILAGSQIAQVIISFGFDGGEQLGWAPTCSRAIHL